MDIAGSLDFAHGYNPAYYNIKVQSVSVPYIVQIFRCCVDSQCACVYNNATTVLKDTL